MPRSRVLIILVVVVVAIGVGGFLLYDQVLRGDSAAALGLPAASSDPATGGAAASFDGTVAGTWNVGSGSVAGYRVREQLATLSAESDAVGRTDAVTGSIAIETSGSTSTLMSGSLTVDTTSITSDKPQRDDRLRREGLQTDTYPTATITLTKPVEIPAAALSGTASDLTLTGDLTIHGVKKSVDIPAKAQLLDGTIQVAGSLSFPLSDYGMTAPNIGGFIISIADTGTLEFLVDFTKA
ncbi:MAG TPA: YceI family protein [Candidatus Limnocylindrales bacterium]|nr:YceI family protein [Candidatus Limnocylindrales bacterium]